MKLKIECECGNKVEIELKDGILNNEIEGFYFKNFYGDTILVCEKCGKEIYV